MTLADRIPAADVKPLRLGLIGLGYGRQVVMPAIGRMNTVRLIAVAASGHPDTESGPEDGVVERLEASALLERDDIDAVIIATPPATHRDLAEKALANGKHVLCEKPCGLGSEDAHSLAAASGRQGLTVAVDYEFRFEPALRELKRRLSGHVIDSFKVRWLTSGRRNPELPWSWQHATGLGGGVVMNFATHVLDYAQWLCGGSVTDLQIDSTIVVPKRPVLPGSDELEQVTAADACVLTGGLGNRTTFFAEISNTHATNEGQRIEIAAPDASWMLHFRLPYTGAAIAFCEDKDGGSEAIPVANLYTPADCDTRQVAFSALLQAFQRRIAGHTEPDLPSAGDAAGVLALVERSS